MSSTVGAVQSAAARSAMVLGQDLPFWYPLNAQLTANQQGVKQVIQVDNDAEFEWRSLISSSTGLFSVTLTNNFLKRPLMPTAVNGENLAGTAQNPGFLSLPRRIARTSVMQAEFNDRSGAPNTIQLCLVGYKKFIEGPRFDQMLFGVGHTNIGEDAT